MNIEMQWLISDHDDWKFFISSFDKLYLKWLIPYPDPLDVNIVVQMITVSGF